MIKKYFIVFLVGLLSLSSCIEISDDLTVHNDGSGSWKYKINLSSSKLKINSLLALDSLDGKKVPSLKEIDQEFQTIKNKLEAKPGISNVVLETNYVDYIFKISCDFTSLQNLQIAVKELVEAENNDKKLPELEHNWISWEGDKLIRSIPELTLKKMKELSQEEINNLKQGIYTSITRFDKPVVKCDNASAMISKNKLAVMLKTNPYSLIVNPNFLENTIYLSNTKN